MRATILNCTLKPPPGTSNTEALAKVVGDALTVQDVEVELLRVLDYDERREARARADGRAALLSSRRR